MNRDLDDGWTDPEGADLLSETMDAMYQGVPADSPTGPAAVVGVMQRRARRRRTAKRTALGAGSLTVAGALAFGAGSLFGWPTAEPPLPPPGQSPSVSPSMSPSPEPTSALELIRDGFRPRSTGVSDITCGMPDHELASTEEGFRLEAVGELTRDGEDLTLPLMLTRTTGDPITEWYSPTLVWIHDGTVVDVPREFREGVPPEAPVAGGGDPIEVPVTIFDPYSMCAPEPMPDDFDFGDVPYLDDQIFPHELPAGDYEVVALIQRFNAGEDDPYVLSEPVPVTITEDQQVVRR